MNSSPVPDSELLNDWISNHRETAFRAIVSRYAGLVYMAAKRVCRNDALAAEAAQLTFIVLAEKAGSLTSRQSLAGWLHITAVMQTKNLLRKSSREKSDKTMLNLHMETLLRVPDGDPWQEMQPVLDDALAALSEKDREALLLRFYRSLSVRETANILGVAIDAAQKRIDRAMERLRANLTQRGCRAGGVMSQVMLAGFAMDKGTLDISVSKLSSGALLAKAGKTTALSHFLPNIFLKHAFILPLCSLIGAGALLGIQHNSISQLQQEHSKQADVPHAHRPSHLHRKAKSTHHQKNKSIDWLTVTKHAGPPKYHLFENPIWVKTRLRLLEMNCAELEEEFRKLSAVNLSYRNKASCKRLFIDTVASKDPGFALKLRTTSLAKNESLDSNLFKLWAHQEPHQAMQWFDEQTSNGNLTDRSLHAKTSYRMDYEQALITALIQADPAAANRRLSSRAPSERSQILSADLIAEESQLNYAKIVREQLPKHEQLETFAKLARGITKKENYQKVPQYLERIQASAEEHEICISHAAEAQMKVLAGVKELKVSMESFREVCDWAYQQSLQNSGKTIGLILSNRKSLVQDADFSVAGEMANQYDLMNQNQDALITLLRSPYAKKNKETALELSEQVRDQQARISILESLQ